MKKQQTNVQFMASLMNVSNQGALIQAFVLTALEKYAQTVQHSTEQDWGETGNFISYQAWRRCADEALDKLNKHFNRQP